MTRQSYRVLFISAPIGSGHVRVAQSIEKELRAQEDVEIDTQIANVFSLFHPTIGKIILSTYLKILKIFPQAYGLAYGWGNKSSFALIGREIISGFLAGRMSKYIENYNPHIIVCTHATPAGLVAYLIRKNKIKVPTIAVVTDYVVHRLWIYSEIQRYIVANEQLKERLLRNKIKPQQIQALGIPVDESFSTMVDRKTVLAKLSFSTERKTILIMGGGAGLLPMDEILKICGKIKYPLQVVVVTGNNKKMLMSIEKMQMEYPLKVFGYVDNVHELMTIADALITKPGGVTVAEALSKGVPLVLFQPIPGQEEANAKQLLSLGAAIQADTINMLKDILEELFISNLQKLEVLKQRALAAGKPDSAKLAARYIIDSIS